MSRSVDSVRRPSPVDTTEPGTWWDRLRLIREARGIKRAQLARLSGVSISSLNSYEVGRRRPARRTLDRILEVLDAKTREADLIRYDLGFSTVSAPPVLHEREHSEARQYLYDVPWPQLAFNAYEGTICGINKAMQRFVSWIYRSREDVRRTNLPTAAMIGLMSAAQVDPSLPHVVNLTERLKSQVALWKHVHGSEEPPWFDKLLEQIALIDKIRQPGESLLARFLQVWDEAPPMAKDYTRIVIGQSDLGQLEFWVQRVVVDEQQMLYLFNLIPANAHTWDCLSALETGKATEPD